MASSTIPTPATVTVTSTVVSSSAASTHVPPQGGILEGSNPSVYDPKNPIILFIIQAGIILIFCRLLHWPLSKLRQPRVIAEVIGGILLGPSVMGHVPGFTSAIFPAMSMPNLNLVANLGLILFLFLVGLEVDLRYLVSNWRVAISVGLAGMALPFGLGCAIAWGLYNQFKNDPNTVAINFGTYMLFIGVAMAITAFPVLCRILTELKLLSTSVGVIVLSAGVGNDVVGWILLALCVALVNAGSGITALWVLLTCLGYALFVIFALRPSFMWLLRYTRALQDGPSQSIIAVTLLMALASAFFTGVIGVHPIFGGFIIGLICPHEGGFAIKVTEKVEDLVSALFLPLYFAISGLGTNLGLLDNGITWGYVVAIIVIAFVGKFVGASVAARANGLVWRECFTIGTLMSCKGLVELIVLNIGLQARILSTRTFTMFVVMALVTTFATTPLTSFLYPSWYQKKLEAWKRGEIDWDTGAPIGSDDASSARDSMSYEKLESSRVQRLLVYLRLDNMPPLLAFLALLGNQPVQQDRNTHPSNGTSTADHEKDTTLTGQPKKKSLVAHGIRLIELTERESSVMKVAEMDEYSMHDPVVNTFRTFGHLNALGVSGEVAVTPESGFADLLVGKASDASADMLLLPWSETGSMSETAEITPQRQKTKLQDPVYSSFVEAALDTSPCTVAVFVSKNFGGVRPPRRPQLSRSYSITSIRSKQGITESNDVSMINRTHHIFFPFFGGPDDRAALRLLMQLAANPDVTVTAVHYQTEHSYFEGVEPPSPIISRTPTRTQASGSGKFPAVASGEVDTLPAERDVILFNSLRSTLPEDVAKRVVFEVMKTNTPVKDALERAESEVGQRPRNAGDLIVLGRNIDRIGAFRREATFEKRTADDIESRSSGPLGYLTQRIVEKGIGASVLVLQARGKGASSE
ncbi:K(+)/H(+) antiporter 1 [Rhizodiscina lignyota]|uniref:K(+)/H(+) antiporter 1 n=1 Tax=Rhizodiscina lignyota TaxID=1504668 RepID=A0A9P4INY1_9PEZI|nr:K(+)/H(+) antiporter 1 [Rhizodiscina lignyota]